MRRFLVIIFIAAAFGCSQPSGYQIKVTLKGAEGKVLLEQRENGAFVGKDTADIVNGIAILKGKVEFPDMYYLSVAGKDQKAILFVENTKMEITGNVDSMRLITVTGSPVNVEYKGVKTKLEKINETCREIYEAYKVADKSGDSIKAKQLEVKYDSVYNTQGVLLLEYIESNPASWVTPLFLSQIQYEKEVGSLDSLVTALDPKLSVVPSVITLKERIEKMKKVADGQIAPDFTLNDPEGNPVKFSDVYAGNTFTLIDFWASWCGPCRQENPNVVVVFNEFKNKGFGVFGVSLDRDKEKWVKAIADDKLTWKHVSDLKYWQSEAAGLYAVNSIPANFLVDKNGKIIAHNLRENALREKIASLLP